MVNGTRVKGASPNTTTATRSPWRRARNSSSTPLRAARRLTGLPPPSVKSRVSIDPEKSTRSSRSRVGRSRCRGGSIHCGRVIASDGEGPRDDEDGEAPRAARRGDGSLRRVRPRERSEGREEGDAQARFRLHQRRHQPDEPGRGAAGAARARGGRRSAPQASSRPMTAEPVPCIGERPVGRLGGNRDVRSI